ncbi:MAG: oligosaccharide flippase family protein [Cyanobacteria bacterium P01_C01_bin.118]
MSAPKDLKQKVIKGGIYLTLRQLLVAVLSLANVLVIARALGPGRYGIVTITLGILYVLNRVLKLGLPAYLVRQPDLPEEMAPQVLAFYNTLSALVCCLLWFVAPAFGWWTGQSEITETLRYSLPAIWLCMVSWVSVSMLERELRFAEVGLIEAISQLANYFISIALVLGGWGYWGPILGAVTRYVIRALMAYRFHPISLFHWRWQWKVLQPALKYGLSYSGSDWLLSLKDLRNSLLVSRLVGVEATGIIGIAIRLVEQLSMLRLIVIRMSISVMAKLMDDREKTRRTISKAMAYQALLIGPVCALFACTADLVIPMLFDERWLASAQIFPLIAIGTLVSSIFDIHASTLYAAGHNRKVAMLNIVYVGCLWLVAALLMPRLGLWGYGIAEVAALPSFFLIHRFITRLYGPPNYQNALWLIGAAIVILLGSIFLSPILATSLFISCYGLLFLVNGNLRQLPTELLTIRRARKSS